MDVLDILRRTGGVNAMAKEIGISPRIASDCTEALLPAIMGGLSKLRDANGHGSGIDGVTAALKRSGGSSMAEAVLLPGETDIGPGQSVMRQIFGGPELIAIVVEYVAHEADADTALVHDMLPMLAMLVGGYICARSGSGGHEGPNDAWMASLLDFDGQDNPLDVIMAAGSPPQT